MRAAISSGVLSATQGISFRSEINPVFLTAFSFPAICSARKARWPERWKVRENRCLPRYKSPPHPPLRPGQNPLSSQARRPAKEVDCHIERDFFRAQLAFIHNLGKTFPGCAHLFLIGDVFRSGASQEISVYGRSDQYTFAQPCGLLEDGMGHEIPSLLSIRIYSPLRGVICSLWGADHIVELIRVYACRIDNAAGGKVTLCGMDQITLSRPGNVGNLCVEMEIHAVHIRISSARAIVILKGQTIPPVGA